MPDRYFRVEVAGSSMRPTLRPGDFLVLRRCTPENQNILRPGNIVAFRDATKRLILKRLIGLPGESLQIGSSVLINRRRVIELYTEGQTPKRQFRGVNQLLENEYFLIGDNREASTDSRDFGAVRSDRFEGIAIFRYWPISRFGRIITTERQFGDERGQINLPQSRIGPPRSV